MQMLNHFSFYLRRQYFWPFNYTYSAVQFIARVPHYFLMIVLTKAPTYSIFLTASYIPCA